MALSRLDAQASSILPKSCCSQQKTLRDITQAGVRESGNSPGMFHENDDWSPRGWMSVMDRNRPWPGEETKDEGWVNAHHWQEVQKKRKVLHIWDTHRDDCHSLGVGRTPSGECVARRLKGWQIMFRHQDFPSPPNGTQVIWVNTVAVLVVTTFPVILCAPLNVVSGQYRRRLQNCQKASMIRQLRPLVE